MTSQTVKGEQKFVAVPGGRISYEVVGDGPAVLCLPSLGDTGVSMNALCQPFKKRAIR
jgi:hypothetical protein